MFRVCRAGPLVSALIHLMAFTLNHYKEDTAFECSVSYSQMEELLGRLTYVVTLKFQQFIVAIFTIGGMHKGGCSGTPSSF